MFRNAALVIVAQGFLALSGCTGTGFPKQAPDGVAEPQIAFTVWERTMPASEGGSTIEIVEVQRVDEHMEHRAIAHLPDGQQYLGPLVPVRGDVPVELLLADMVGLQIKENGSSPPALLDPIRIQGYYHPNHRPVRRD